MPRKAEGSQVLGSVCPVTLRIEVELCPPIGMFKCSPPGTCDFIGNGVFAHIIKLDEISPS
jgi:hypothetical protein